MSLVSDLKKRIARIEAEMEAAAIPAREAAATIRRAREDAKKADIARRERMRGNPKKPSIFLKKTTKGFSLTYVDEYLGKQILRFSDPNKALRMGIGIAEQRDMELINEIPAKYLQMRENPKIKYKHKHISSPSQFAKGSIRTIARGKTKVRIGCPKKQYNKKAQQCRVATRVVSILMPNTKGKTFRVFAKKANKFYYYNGEGFDTNYTIAQRYFKDAAISAAKAFSCQYPAMSFGVSDGKA